MSPLKLVFLVLKYTRKLDKAQLYFQGVFDFLRQEKQKHHTDSISNPKKTIFIFKLLTVPYLLTSDNFVPVRYNIFS